MPRRIPNSAKKKRDRLRVKRAVKRGDVSPPPKLEPRRRKGAHAAGSSYTRLNAAVSAQKLQSSFVKLPKPFLDLTRDLAANLPLPRPIPVDAAIFPELEQGAQDIAPLVCPRRPKWRYDMSKKEIDANEGELFKRWLAQTDDIVNRWCNVDTPPPPSGTADAPDEPESTSEPKMPRAPTSFERNLEVWRQLWRVTEISQLLLVLLDSRCPLLHIPPALAAFLSSSSARIILVLTKVDISGPACADAWTRFLGIHFPGLRVVQVASHAPAEPGNHGPALPVSSRQALLAALCDAHAELLDSSAEAQSDPASRGPRVRRAVDWEAVAKADGALVGKEVDDDSKTREQRGRSGDALGGKKEKEDEEEGDEESDDEDEDEDEESDDEEEEGDEEDVHEEGKEKKEEQGEPEFLTIGLIGQPNVGKSSLLNALFGTHKVKASKTPGKTKHFQTLFWTPEVRLVDCPGLVIPNFVPMEMQVLSGILPISRVSAVPLCIHHASQFIPLERVLGLTHPEAEEVPAPDKRTWRAGMRPRDAQANGARERVWTAMDVLTAFALKKGYVTAQVGRPDVHRAGNAILRALAEGRIHWAFWPPGTDAETIQQHQEPGTGIWIPASGGDEDIASEIGEDEVLEGPSSDDEDKELGHGAYETVSEDEDEDEEDEDSDKKDKAGTLGGVVGRFGALLNDSTTSDVPLDGDND